MENTTSLISVTDAAIQSRILTVRGVQVILDKDIAELYGVGTKALNQAVKRNNRRFPAGFMFQLSNVEWTSLRSQIVTSNNAEPTKRGGTRYLPYAFTEHGITMLASVLNSDTAIAISVRVINTFVSMRRALSSLAPLLLRIESAERRQIIDQSKNEANQARNEERFEKIFDAMSDKSFPPQKVFFDGEFFDAFVQIKKFIRQAKKTLIVIDPYFDDSCLTLIAQKKPGVSVSVVRLSKGAKKSLHSADVLQFNKQFANSLDIRLTDRFHDRYLIIDGTTLIHVGASLNCLGKKCFAFSTMDPIFIPDIVSHIPSTSKAGVT